MDSERKRRERTRHTDTLCGPKEERKKKEAVGNTPRWDGIVRESPFYYYIVGKNI